MKKLLFIFVLALVSVVALSACNAKTKSSEQDSQHVHTYSDVWSKDDTYHWHAASCEHKDEVKDKEAHSYGDWTVTKQASETETGLKKRTCSVCGFEQTETIAKLDHVHEFSGEWKYDETNHYKECACGEKGEIEAHKGGTATETEKAVCEVCGAQYGDLLPHTHNYVDGVCSCGKTEEGYFDKNIDGDNTDWSSDLENALSTFGADTGTGFSVIGYHKDGKAYFAVTFKTTEASPTSFEIFQKDGATRYILKYNKDLDKWFAEDGSDYLVAVYGSYSKESDLNTYFVESIWDFKEFPQEENGNYRINFASAVFEKSAASFSDSQPEYWVLYGKNAWDASWNYELKETTEIGHEHLLDENRDCIICGESFQLEDLAITLDGKLDEWPEEVKTTMLQSYDEEDRFFKQVGFIDSKYVYLFVSVAHREAVGNLNIIVGGNHFGQIVSGSVFTGNNVEALKVLEESDDLFNITNYEFVLSLEKLQSFAPSVVNAEGAKLGIDVNFETEESNAFACSPTKLGMWAIAGYNSCSVANNFSYTKTGVLHDHSWDIDRGICILCGEEAPHNDYDIEVDGDLSDWNQDILTASLKTYGTEGNGFEVAGYHKNGFLYLAVTIKTLGATPNLFGLVDTAGAEYLFRFEGDKFTKSTVSVAVGTSVSENTYVLEGIVDLAKFTPNTDGNYVFGLEANVNETSKASFSESNAAYWVMYGRNAWNSVENLFTFTGSGITHKHIMGEWEHDETKHFRSCACGYTEEEEHKGGTSTEDTLAVCEVCGTPYGELADHVHNYVYHVDGDNHYASCSCGSTLASEAHSGGTATETALAVCDKCGASYGKYSTGYSIVLDGENNEWKENVVNARLKGFYGEEGQKRGLEYMAFFDDQYIYLFTHTVTASNTDKSFDIIFNVDGELKQATLDGSKAYKLNQNVALENGLYDTKLEVVLNKTDYVNSLGRVFLGIWFMGCDDSFAPLSWYEEGKTTIWTLAERCPWWKNTMSHQEVTANGFDHFHDMSNGVCLWCQEEVKFAITVDGKNDDWSDAILNTSKSLDGKNKLKASAFTDESHLYLFVEITNLTATEANYLVIEGSNASKVRGKTGFGIYHDAGSTFVRPWCNGSWACTHNYNDCDNGYEAYALTRETNGEGQVVVRYELVIKKSLIAQAGGEVWIEVSIDDTAGWGSGQALTDWKYMKVTEEGIA